MITIRQVRSARKEDLAAVNGLLRQLSDSARRLNMAAYRRLLANKNLVFLAARDGDHMIGMGSLVLMEIPVAFRTRMEDLVVDEAYRGQGIGTRLSEAIVALAKKKGGISIDFTSSPERGSANKLYERMGFEKRDTNVYRLKLK